MADAMGVLRALVERSALPCPDAFVDSGLLQLGDAALLVALSLPFSADFPENGRIRDPWLTLTAENTFLIHFWAYLDKLAPEDLGEH